MEDFFTRVPDAVWDRQDRLHVYATPNDALREVVSEYQDTLGRTPASDHGLGIVPPRWLHATVQMLRTAVDELDGAQREELTVALRREVAAVAPLELIVGPPQVSRHAVELWISPDADQHWLVLVEAVRSAVRAVLGEAALPALGPNAVPHTSIAYGVDTGDSGHAMSLLKGHRRQAVSVPITEVQLVAVSQHPEQGFFSWDEIAALSLAEK